MVERTGEKKKGNVGKALPGQQVFNMPRESSDGTPFLRTLHVHRHLSPFGEPNEPQASIAPDEDVLLSSVHPRPMSLCFYGHAARVQAVQRETRMAVSSLPNQFTPHGFTSLSRDCQRAFARRSGPRPEELVRQLGTLPAPVLSKPRFVAFMDPLTTLVYQANTVSPSKKHFVISSLLLFLFLFG